MKVQSKQESRFLPMTRSRKQNEKMRRERKKQIMQVALHQFTAKGLFATKVKDIAEEAGIAQGLIYHYFESKEEIFIELIKEALDKMNEASYA
ncbi:MAG TPA: TetR/AcrR family transcriptional regulator, partial [Firmicutes bacterium]|nr:TetR/AcrR family transcriptional regulator [Bacillota bacterium]